ncbi:MAG: VapC toxin family PIN domain ribonuclease [Chloroflexi bacterium CFX4]|nr:VapC toxin family PIN domain ribonuclease [Chloroflexi bacterium CFX4]MDL1922367.1 PIN domain-containing protein [Chloroflexi bacterium CFX3]
MPQSPQHLLHIAAQKALLKLRMENKRLWISHQAIREYIANASRPQSYSPPIPMLQILAQVQRFRETFHVGEGNLSVLDALLEIIGHVAVGGKQIHDANIVATMRAYNIPVLLTNNATDFARYEAYITVLSL